MAKSRTLIEFDRRNPRLTCLPDEIAIEPIMGCNLRCPMCPIADIPNAMGGRTPVLMTMDVYRRILGQISDKPRSILLTMIGEPLMHPQIVDFVALAKERRHHVGLITNGTKLTSALSGRLLDAKLDALVMSIDGYTKATYESLRIGAHQETVVENLKRLASENARRGGPLKIEINYCVSIKTEGEKDALCSGRGAGREIIRRTLSCMPAKRRALPQAERRAAKNGPEGTRRQDPPRSRLQTGPAGAAR